MNDERDRPVTEVTPAMVEAGVDAYFLNRVEEHTETMEDCRQVVLSILLAGLREHQLAC